MKKFNTTGACTSTQHYMVDIGDCLEEIKQLVDDGSYFVISRARQYGKTTLLTALAEKLSNIYTVISLDFQLLSNRNFETEDHFTEALSGMVLDAVQRFNHSNTNQINSDIKTRLYDFSLGHEKNLTKLFVCFSDWCRQTDRPILLIIDEIDKAGNYPVFLDFLSLLRGYYIQRNYLPTFHSVILAGVYDIKNLKSRVRSKDEHTTNNPWNIAADFDVDMSLSEKGISEMLKEYDTDRHTDMDVSLIAKMLYDYTSGYPFLVSRICKLMDEKISKQFTEKFAWSKQGFFEALKLLYNEQNTLFDSLTHRLGENQELKKLVYDILFIGRSILYNPDNPSIEHARMFGFIKNQNGSIVIANRIFETRLYNMFLSTEAIRDTSLYTVAVDEKNHFIKNGCFDMDLVIERFVFHYTAVYGNMNAKFAEEEGRKYFLLYLRPIINGNGNYYVEAHTRDSRRTDIIVDYKGEQFIIELKLWNGIAYHREGEQQLSDYLDTYGLKKGYMIIYNFNKKKQAGVKTVYYGDKVLVEAMV